MRSVTVSVLNTDGDKEPNTVWVWEGHLTDEEATARCAVDAELSEQDLLAQGSLTHHRTVTQ